MGPIILNAVFLTNVCGKKKRYLNTALTVSVTWFMFFEVGVLVVSLCVRQRFVVKRMDIGIIDGG